MPEPRIPFGSDDENRGRKSYPRVTHELTAEQIEKVRDAIGDGSTWPKHTDDPRVNYAVDCLVSYEDKPPPYVEVEQDYVDEIAALALQIA